jgi:hypothetical protein
VPSPRALPDEARAGAWRALWDHLVLGTSREFDPEPHDPDSDGDTPERKHRLLENQDTDTFKEDASAQLKLN